MESSHREFVWIFHPFTSVTCDLKPTNWVNHSKLTSVYTTDFVSEKQHPAKHLVFNLSNQVLSLFFPPSIQRPLLSFKELAQGGLFYDYVECHNHDTNLYLVYSCVWCTYPRLLV